MTPGFDESAYLYMVRDEGRRRHPVQQQLQFIPVVDDDRDQYSGGDKCGGHLFVVSLSVSWRSSPLSIILYFRGENV